MKNYKRLGDYIREVNVRNRDLTVTKLVGLTIDKAFIPSVANIIGTDMSTYKIIRREQFACSLMQVSRDAKIPVAMLNEDEVIMSPAYPIFEVVDKNMLLPQYLMMWFSRPEFDREASFHAVGGVRGSLTWEDFCNMTLPIPSIETQKEIVEEYDVLTRRITLNQEICNKLEATAQALYRKMFVDDIDPENLPNGWRMGTIGDYAKVKSGFAFKSDMWTNFGTPVVKIGSIQNNSIDILCCEYVNPSGLNITQNNKAKFGDIVIAMTGATIGKIAIIPMFNDCFLINQRVGLFDLGPNPSARMAFLYFLLQEQYVQNEVTTVGGDSAQENVSNSDIDNIKVVIPPFDLLCSFNEIGAILLRNRELRKCENRINREFQLLLLSKLIIN